MVWSSYQTVFSFMNWCDIHSACSSIIRARYTFSFFLLLNDIIVAKQIIRPYMFTYLCSINTNHSENYLQKKKIISQRLFSPVSSPAGPSTEPCSAPDDTGRIPEDKPNWAISRADLQLSDGSMTSYADDIMLYCPIYTPSDYSLLQQDIDDIWI